MGNASSVVEKDYTRKKGQVIPEVRSTPIPKESQLSPGQLAVVFPYLDEQASRLADRVESLNASGGWDHDYGSVTEGEDAPCTVASMPENDQLNRYKNILAFDHSRVKVTPNAFNGNRDYVNANWIPGYKQNRGYIASQGPVPESMAAFWQMVWQCGSTCIVMVTNEIEGNKLKCHRYWPSRESPVETYGAVSVSLLEETVKSTYIHRVFELKCDGGKSRLNHLQYTVWPDHGVPNSTAELISFRKEVRKLHPHPAPPIVVHCSAGVGRTGTYIVVDTLMNRAEHLEKDLDVRKVLQQLRSNRMFMVQTVVQYQFAFKTILDSLERSLARTVRAVQNKSDEIAQVAANIEELEMDLGDATEGYGGNEHGEAFETLTQQVGGGKRIKPDVRWSAFNASDDLSAATKVPATLRMEALASSSDIWRARRNGPTSPQDKGYDGSHRVGLVNRVEALSISAAPDAWKSKYSEMSSTWASDVYDVSASLNPLESRMMSLAQQSSNWRLRGQDYRRQVEEDAKAIIADLNDRLSSLGATLATADERWRSKGDGFRTSSTIDERSVSTVDHQGGLMDRLQSLVKETRPDAWKSKASVEGREVESPNKAKVQEKATKEASEKERLVNLERLEAEKIAKDQAERKKREEAARLEADKRNPAAKAAAAPAIDRPAKQMVQLRSAKKEADVHPMLAMADDYAAAPAKGKDGRKK